MQPPKTEENETATKMDPAPCHTLKCPNLSIYQGNNRKPVSESHNPHPTHKKNKNKGAFI